MTSSEEHKLEDPSSFPSTMHHAAFAIVCGGFEAVHSLVVISWCDEMIPICWSNINGENKASKLYMG